MLGESRRGSAEASRFSIKCSDNVLQFGAGDLVLEVMTVIRNWFASPKCTIAHVWEATVCHQGDMQRCTSYLDRSYGFGLNSSGEITRFLCGANQFAVEQVEIWEVV